MQCNLFKPSSFLKQLIIYKMCFVKRMKLHDLLGNPSFPKKLIIHISGNIHIFTGQSLNLRERNGKINQRYRAIFTWRWMKMCEQNRNNKWALKEWFEWFIDLTQAHVAFGWLSEHSGEKTSCPRSSKNQSIPCFDVILQQDWPVEQCSVQRK